MTCCARKHSVLYVGFEPPLDCPLSNAQPASPEVALAQLSDGSSWAAVLHHGARSRQALDWIMRVRHHPASAGAVLLAMVDDSQGPLALQALRAGADVVLPAAAPPPLLQAQLARLRERVAPAALGSLHILPGHSLHAQARELRGPRSAQRLQPQLFRLLWTLCEHPGRVVDSASLRVALDIPARADAQALHTAVGKLRRVLREHALAAHLQTVHASGYRWVLEPVAPLPRGGSNI